MLFQVIKKDTNVTLQRSLHDVGKVGDHSFYSCSEFTLSGFFSSVPDAFLQISSYNKWWHRSIFFFFVCFNIKKTQNSTLLL